MSTSAEHGAGRAWPGLVALVACAALWSLNGPLIKLLSQEHVPAVTIACYRSLLGGVVFLPFALRRFGTLRRVHVGWSIASVLTFTLMTASFVIATTLTAAANAIILQYTSPIWVFVLSPLLLKERPGLLEGLVLLGAMAGIAVIFSGHPDASVLGLVVALFSGLGYGALTVVLRGLRAADPFAVAAWNALGSGAILLGPATLGGSLALNAYTGGLMLLMAFVQFTAPYVLFSWALQRVEAHRAALIVLLEAVLNPLWTYLWIGEQPPAATLVGGPMILASVATWMLLTPRRGKRGNPADASGALTSPPC